MCVQRCSGMQSFAMALLGQKQLCIRFIFVASILIFSHLNTCNSPFTLEIDLSGIALVRSVLIIGVRLHMERKSSGHTLKHCLT